MLVSITKMKTAIWFLFLSAFTVTATVDAVEQKSHAELIARRGSETWADRQAATRELVAIGQPAMEALKIAQQSTDAEVRWRATCAIRAINDRWAAAQIEGE